MCDHLGTPLAMFDADGRQTWSLDLDIYGQLRELGGAREACPFRFPGQYEDSETGLYYNRFRYYDPEAGVYLSQDPIGLAGGNPTLYGYVHDPLTWVDPWGLACAPKQPRYQGKKPKYHVNQAHVPGPNYNRNKEPLPSDAAEVYKKAIPGAIEGVKTWFGKNSKGIIYRFSDANDGTAHFSGSDASLSGIRNISDYALQRLEDL